MAPIYRVDDSFDFSLFDGASCAFGVFDGVHTGHRYLLDAAIESAAQSGGRSIALTFDIDPDEIFDPAGLKKLLSNEDRLEVLAASGVDAVCALPFTREFAANEPLQFLQSTFGGHVPAFLHVGSDFAFGAKAAGHVSDLQEWAAQSGTVIHAHHLVSSDGRPISATRIRGLLANGEINMANRLLGRPYAIHEKVFAGRQDGRDFGFRTANLLVLPQQKVIADGVYAGIARVDGVPYKAAISSGVSPVFKDESTANCEVHLLDFDGDLYGQRIWVEYHHWLRPMMKFSSTEELISTVMGNIQWVRDNMILH